MSGEDIETVELSGAIHAARLQCEKHPGAHPDRIEAWSGTGRLYPSIEPDEFVFTTHWTQACAAALQHTIPANIQTPITRSVFRTAERS